MLGPTVDLLEESEMGNQVHLCFSASQQVGYPPSPLLDGLKSLQVNMLTPLSSVPGCQRGLHDNTSHS